MDSLLVKLLKILLETFQPEDILNFLLDTFGPDRMRKHVDQWEAAKKAADAAFFAKFGRHPDEFDKR